MYIEPSSTALASTWAPRTERDEDWREIDRALRGIAVKRAALDAEEARWLREAERVQIWKQVGMVSALDYMERILGYAPRTAQERLRVARALGDMPKLEAAMRDGNLAFSAVREVSRLATPETEGLWAEFATGVSLRDIEEVVASHERGDKPTDPPKPIVRDRKVTFELPPETYAMLRQVQSLATEEHGRHLEAHEVLAEALRAFLDRGPKSERTGADQYTIAVTVCESCKQGWQTGGGKQIAVDSTVVDRASCSALHVGSLDRDLPERAKHAPFPPAIARFIRLRDQGRCQTPGCRSTVGIEAHHIDPDGSNHPSNGTSRCDGCHTSCHNGLLEITGTAPDNITTRWVRASDQRPNVSASESEHSLPATRLDDTILATQAKDALVGLGWKPAIARAAVDEARVHVGADAKLEDLVREALRRCPKPSARAT